MAILSLEFILGCLISSAFGALVVWFFSSRRRQADDEQLAPPPNQLQQVNAMAAQVACSNLPSFFSNDPEGWFTSLDMQFDEINASELTRMRKSVAKLPSEVACKLKHITARPFQAGDYQLVKDEIERLFGKSMDRRWKELQELVQVQSTKPSEILLQIRSLANTNQPNRSFFMDDKELKLRFQHALPLHIQDVIRPRLYTTHLDQLVELADGEYEAFQGRELMTAASTLTSAHIEAISKHSKQHKPKEGAGMCFYHFRFGDKAKRCGGPPCPKNGAGQQ